MTLTGKRAVLAPVLPAEMRDGVSEMTKEGDGDDWILRKPVRRGG